MRNRIRAGFSIIAAGMFAISLFGASADAATLTVQTVTNRTNYAPLKTVTIKATAQLGQTRITSSKISSATVTIKDARGTTIVNGASMSKDSATGMSFYNYTLVNTAAKGLWTATVSIRDTSSNTGTASATFTVQLPVPDHSTLVSAYEGTKTCLACHSVQGNDMFASVHYQWTGDSQKAIELDQVGSKASKMGGINNFCIQPDMNWLTVFNKVDGTKGPGGCAVCHAGLGLKPSPTVSQQQLENIDCLICHAPVYSRKVVQNADASFSLVPADGVDVLKAAQSVTRPGRAACMRCHQNSGGGNNFKRGDIESTLIACNKSYDVHMGTDGQDFACQECHRTEKHRMAGRGVDMRALDSTRPLDCETCHTQLPHRSTNTAYTDLNRHTDKVNCTVCHVTTFAKSIATDMHRNWSKMELDTAKQLYDPEMIKVVNVMPEYFWFNGFTHFYRFKDPVSPDSRGIQKLVWPDGGFVDSSTRFSKLQAFKVHEGMQPIENTTRQLLPLRNKIAFETANVDLAISEGAKAYGMTYSSHSFFPTEQFMGIYHGVGPKNTALSCSTGNCHGSGRINFAALGYQRRGTTAQLCDVCHSAKSAMTFKDVHSKHRGKKNCAACHGEGYPLKEPKATLCDNCHSYKSESDPNRIHSKHVSKYDCSSCHTYTADPNSLTGHTKDR